MKSKFDVVMVVGNKHINDFMGSADLNDRGLKYFGEVHRINVSYKEGEKISRSRLFKLLKGIMNFKDGDYEAIYARVVSSNTKHNLKDLYMIKEKYEKIKEISNGKFIQFIDNLKEIQ